MDRRVSVGVGAVIVGLALFIAFRGPRRADQDEPKPFATTVLADSGLGAATTTTQATAEIEADPSALHLVGDNLGDFTSPDASQAQAADDSSGPGSYLPDGGAVPSLPDKAPQKVRFGVVLVAYRGAQSTASDGPPSARSKKEALELAQKLAVDAQSDFHGAVGRGDPGSNDDLGRVPRGVLEPAPEYVLFTMPAGTVSEPIDTPRGFWIVKRID